MRGLAVLIAIATAIFLGDPARSQDGQANKPGGGPLKVLFVGNSLTGFNDLPGTIAALAKAGGKDFTKTLPGLPCKAQAMQRRRQSSTEEPSIEFWKGQMHETFRRVPCVADGRPIL